MKANPGGEIAPEHVLGRDPLVDQVWRILERQSLVLVAERRMGKSCLIKKMTAHPRPGFLPIYRDLEGVKDPFELVELVYRDVERHLSRMGKIAGRVRKIAQRLQGLEVGRFKIPPELASDWKRLLAATIKDLATQQGDRVVFFWDEVPYMLQNLDDRETARDVLDNLRAIRQSIPEVRMVFTGSIGLHHVLAELREQEISQAPTNDMYTLEVPPLDPEAGADLARRLLLGEGLRPGDPEAAARAVSEAADRIPYYIHHLVDQLVRTGGEPTPAGVAGIVDRCLDEPSDPWHMRHFRERLVSYYDEAELLALAVLDDLAPMDGGLDLNTLWNTLQAQETRADKEELRTMLDWLEQDHYLRRRDGRFTFASELVRRWWCRYRSLT